MRKFLIIAGLSSSLVNFRGPLLQALVAAGHEVHAAGPDLSADPPTAAALREMGVHIHDVPLARAGVNPLKDMRSAIALFRLMREIRPDAVLGYTIKPVVWGTLAAWLARVPHRFALVTGLGYAFTGKARGKRKFVQLVARALYGLSLRHTHLVFFQNPDDAQLFSELRLLSDRIPVQILNGSGVDTRSFVPAPFREGPLRFLLIARLLGDKGIREFAAAAARIRPSHPGITFELVGPHDLNPDAISQTELSAWTESGTLVWSGAMGDVRPALAACHVYVLPSYREGTPRTVLEAMAMGRPIITTDAPGCRETVINGKNGFLVPVGDPLALYEAMKHFIDDPTLMPKMGKASREIALEKYDVDKINEAMLKAMRL